MIGKKKNFNNLKLSYQLEVIMINKGIYFSDYAVNINIYNHNDYKVNNLVCRSSLVNYGHTFLLGGENVNFKEIKPNCNVIYESGYWADHDRAYFETRYFMPSAKTKELIEPLKILGNRCANIKGKNIKFKEKFEKAYKETMNLILRGFYHVEFVEFNLAKFEYKPGNILYPDRCFDIPLNYIEFIEDRYLELLSNENIKWVISHYKNKNVLVIGNDSGEGLKNMQEISRELKKQGFEPILLRDKEDIKGQNLEEKVMTYALMSFFVVADDSIPSGHIAELSLLIRNRIITAVLRKKGIGSTYVINDYDVDFGNYVKAWAYELPNLEKIIPKIIDWADNVFLKRKLYMKKRYPWQD